MPTRVLRFRYEKALAKLKQMADKPDFSPIGEEKFYAEFRKCKALHNQIVDIESAGQSK